MRILVTGGTGFLGKHLVRALLAARHTVRVLSRDERHVYATFGTTVEAAIGDPNDTEVLERAVEHCDAIYHLLGRIGEYGVSEEEFYRINVTITENLLAAAAAAGVERFIHCSSGGVLGPLPDGTAANEFAPHAPSNPYERSKSEAEHRVWTYRERMGVTIIRPEFVFGEEDTHVLGFFRQVKRGFFPLFGNGHTLLHPTYVDDLTRAFLLVLENPSTQGERYIVSGPHPISVRDFVAMTAGVLGVRCIPIWIPVWIGLVLGYVCEQVFGRMLGRKPPLTMAMVKFFSENRNYPSDRIAELGLERTTTKEGMKRTVAWYRQNGWL